MLSTVMELIGSLFAGGPQSLFAGLFAAVIAAGVMFFKGRAAGRDSERAKHDRAKVDALEDQLEMHREADAIERHVGEMNREQLEKEAGKWSRPGS